MIIRTRPIIRRSIIAFAALGLLVIVISSLLVDVIPKRRIALSVIQVTRGRIDMYLHQHHQLPANLDVLPVRENYGNRLTDGWDRRLLYSVESPESFTLSSFGRDGVVGGSGEDADIVRRFRVVQDEIQQMP